MDEQKPWYLSRTIWASIITVCATVGGAFGFVIEDGDAAALADAILAAVAAGAGIFAIVGRLLARTRIG